MISHTDIIMDQSTKSSPIFGMPEVLGEWTAALEPAAKGQLSPTEKGRSDSSHAGLIGNIAILFQQVLCMGEEPRPSTKTPIPYSQSSQAFASESALSPTKISFHSELFQKYFASSVSIILEETVRAYVDELVVRAQERADKKARTVRMIGGSVFSIRCLLTSSEPPTFEITNSVAQGTSKTIRRVLDLSHQVLFARAKIKNRKLLPQRCLEKMSQTIDREYSLMVFCQEKHVRHVLQPLLIRKQGSLTIGFDFEYCSVGNADQLKVLFPLAKREILQRLHILLDIAETLTDLHALHLCPTDFKPQNILLTSRLPGELEAKICDFEGIEAEGQPIAQCNFLFSDYETRKGFREDIAMASNEGNIWSLGLFIFNFIYGELENPICALLEEVPSEEDWEQARQTLLSKLSKGKPIDDLIYSIFAPPRDHRPTAKAIASRLETIIGSMKESM